MSPRQLRLHNMRSRIALTMSQSINQPGSSEAYERSVEQYAAFTNMPATSLQERDQVVRRAMAEFAQFFPELREYE